MALGVFKLSYVKHKKVHKSDLRWAKIKKKSQNFGFNHKRVENYTLTLAMK